MANSVHRSELAPVVQLLRARRAQPLAGFGKAFVRLDQYHPQRLELDAVRRFGASGGQEMSKQRRELERRWEREGVVVRNEE